MKRYFLLIDCCHLDFFLYIKFDNRTDSALLESPPYSIFTPVCLRFQYNISSTKVYVRVMITSPTRPQPYQVLQLTYGDQNPTSNWSTANVPLPDGLTRLQFVADKVGVTVDSASAMIDDVTIVDGGCSLLGLYFVTE